MYLPCHLDWNPLPSPGSDTEPTTEPDPTVTARNPWPQPLFEGSHEPKHKDNSLHCIRRFESGFWRNVRHLQVAFACRSASAGSQWPLFLQLDLTPEQLTRFKAERDRFHAQLEELGQQIKAKQIELIDSSSSGPTDQQSVERKQEEIQRLQGEVQDRVIVPFSSGKFTFEFKAADPIFPADQSAH